MERVTKLIFPQNHSVQKVLTEKQRYLKAEGSAGQLDWMNLKRSDGEDDTLPGKVDFSWECEETESLFELAENAAFDGARVIRTQETHISIGNLKMDQAYYWRVNGGEAFSFRTEDAAPRWIEVGGVSNVRDIGAWRTKSGKKIRQGLLFRGGELNEHMFVTEQGLRTLREELGIRTDLDLRGEAVGKTTESPMGADVNFQLISTVAYGDFFKEEQQETCRRLFSVLAEQKNYPMYFHCWGGADRTGTLALMLQAILGAYEEDMLLDYELTSLSIWGPRKRTDEWFQPLLEALDRYGNAEDSMNKKAENFLLSCGVTPEQIASIREIFLEE